jgi:lipopolysaccharide biosynthesis glycosyltransferase
LTNAPFYPDSIPIVFAVNDYYAPYMAVMMQSIMENSNKKKRYCFFVLFREINRNNIDLIMKQISFFPQFSVDFIDVSQCINEYYLFTSNHITVETYFRLLIPYMFTEYQEVIYLDGDMICCTDIATLFDINIKDYILTAVLDWHSISYSYSPDFSDDNTKLKYEVLLNLKNPYNYFNGGLIIFNIELFHKTILMKDLFDLAQSRNWQFHDQDVLNYLCEGKILFLPFHWNFIFTPYAKHLPEHQQNEYNEAKKYPKIIHYKPWNCENYILHFELFWKYATHTPFISIIIGRMKSNDFIYNESFEKRIISNIKHRQGIGLRFLLTDCIKAWLSRDKK